jgi:hypothetical protein
MGVKREKNKGGKFARSSANAAEIIRQLFQCTLSNKLVSVGINVVWFHI